MKSSAGTLPTDRQFQGQQDQAGIGLYHMGDRWYDPTATYFRVRAEDGAMYILRHDERAGAWTLEAFRRTV